MSLNADRNYSSPQSTHFPAVWSIFFSVVNKCKLLFVCFFCLFWAFQGSREYKFPVKHIIDKLLHVTGRLWFIGQNMLCFQEFENQSFNYPCKQTWILSSLPGIWALLKPKSTHPFFVNDSCSFCIHFCGSGTLHECFFGGHLPFLHQDSSSYVKSRG